MIWVKLLKVYNSNQNLVEASLESLPTISDPDEIRQKFIELVKIDSTLQNDEGKEVFISEIWEDIGHSYNMMANQTNLIPIDFKQDQSRKLLIDFFSDWLNELFNLKNFSNDNASSNASTFGSSGPNSLLVSKEGSNDKEVPLSSESDFDKISFYFILNFFSNGLQKRFLLEII